MPRQKTSPTTTKKKNSTRTKNTLTKANRLDKSKLADKDRHGIFIREYVRHGNATRAAVSAGYEATSASQYAQTLLKNHKILASINSLCESRRETLDIQTDKLAAELMIMATSRLTDIGEIIDGEFRICDTTTLTDTDIAAIASITQTRTERGNSKVTRTEVKMHDRLTAIKELNRILGLGQDLNALISGLRAYGLSVVQDTSGKYTLIDERIPVEQSNDEQ